MVHPEIVLQGDGRICLGRRFNLHTLLGFNRLMESIREPAAIHDPPCLLVDNLYFVVHQNVIHVLFKQRIRLEQLIHRVHTRAFHTIIGHQLALHLELRFFVTWAVINGHQFRCQIRHREELVVIHVGRQVFNTALGQLHLVLLFVNDEVQLLICLRHLSFVVLKIDSLRLQQLLLHPFSTQKLDERLGFGQCAVSAKQR